MSSNYKQALDKCVKWVIWKMYYGNTDLYWNDKNVRQPKYQPLVRKTHCSKLDFNLGTFIKVNNHVAIRNVWKLCQVLAVAARKLADAQEFAKKHSIPRAYGSYEELARDPDIGECLWDLQRIWFAGNSLPLLSELLCEKWLIKNLLLEVLFNFSFQRCFHFCYVF